MLSCRFCSFIGEEQLFLRIVRELFKCLYISTEVLLVIFGKKFRL